MDDLFTQLLTLPSPVPQFHVVIDTPPSDQTAAISTSAVSVGSILGIIGTVTGTAAFVVSVMTYRRDAARIRVRIQRGYRVTQGPGDDAVRRLLAAAKATGKEPPMAIFLRDPDKSWAYISVVNHGRRPVTVDKIGWIGKNGKFMIPGGFMGDHDWLPKKLDEGDAKEYPVEESHLIDALAGVAVDRTGRLHVGSYARSLGGFRVWLLRTLRLKYR